jgi:hemerythrin superfamily protein
MPGFNRLSPGREVNPMPDAYEFLAAEHRTVEVLLQRYQATGDEAVAREVVDALTLHAEIEEQVLYPELRRVVDGGDDFANQAENEHALVKTLLARIVNAPPGDLRSLLEEVGRDVAEHVEREEGTIFPAMQQAGVDAGALGQRLEAARGEAPSRSSGQVG